MGKNFVIFFLVILFCPLFTTYSFAFSEIFDSQTIDSTKWLISTNSGVINWGSNYLHLENQNGKNFPFIRTVDGVISDNEDSIEIEFRYPSVGNFGTGISISDALPDNQTVLSPNHKDYIQILVWQDGPNGLKIYTTLCPQVNQNCSRSLTLVASYGKPDNAIHKIKSVFDENDASITVYFDENLIFTSAIGQSRPKNIWLGTPEFTNSNDKWSPLDIFHINSNSLVPTNSTPPILLVPGFGASWDYQSILTNIEGDSWHIPEWINTYDNLIDSFQNAGYAKDTSLFVYPYDWRKPLSQQADKLNEYIEGLKTQNKITSTTRINFVAHSFGGLVTRAYLDKYGTANLNKLVTAGSPHLGSANAYKTWSGGQILLGNWWQKAALSLLTGLNTINGESPVTAVRRLSPSIKDILPTYDFLQDANAVIKPLSQMTISNTSLIDLGTDLAPINASTSAIAGNRINTTDRLTYGQPNWLDSLLGKWTDGKPVSDIFAMGDGTVTQQSGHGNFTNVLVSDLNHGGLVFDIAGIGAIFQELDLDVSKVVATRSAQNGNNPIVSILRSPGNLKLLTPSGQLVGMGEPATNSAVVIEDQKIVIIPKPEVGDYLIQIAPDGNTGPYSLYAGYSNSLGLTLKRIDAVLEDNDTDTFRINSIELLSPLEPTNTPDFVEIILETTSRLNSVTENSLITKSRIENTKTYLSDQFGDYTLLSVAAQRSRVLTTINNLFRIKSASYLSDENQVLIDDLLYLLMDESQKKTEIGLQDPRLYDLLYTKNASGSANLEANFSTSSGILLEPLLSILTPQSSESSNLAQDLAILFLKSIFQH